MGITVISKSNWLFRGERNPHFVVSLWSHHVIKGECMINPDEDGNVEVPNNQRYS